MKILDWYREAVNILIERKVDFEFDGEMHNPKLI